VALPVRFKRLNEEKEKQPQGRQTVVEKSFQTSSRRKEGRQNKVTGAASL